ncbi:hypothetical protein Amet_1401 [Alkaliphilus metalliredigens QYMF]|uniref:Uncharacterized protein n=1 Tax=Alkaliphilus metalliredigens (strain QYMF) TaxID=293826 RepID=A6TN33_ALKMQ|nr:hypothetical protein [Alkaliphilus metalliredigens]ABR47601.1 hypothetical protein Amet_1401 [Alkaliphilus metalliredigens QYMF]
MFEFGIFLMLLGAICVYGTNFISKKLSIDTVKGILVIKGSGLVLTIAGAIVIFIF